MKAERLTADSSDPSAELSYGYSPVPRVCSNRSSANGPVLIYQPDDYLVLVPGYPDTQFTC